MRCEVCGHTFDQQGDQVCYCARCGWSLGRLTVRVDPSTLTFAGAKKILVTLICRNEGHGELTCSIGELPRGVGLAQGVPQEWTLGLDPKQIMLEVDPLAVDERSMELALELWANDRHGAHKLDYRPIPLQSVRARHVCTLPLQRRRFGPVHLFQEMLLFGNSHGQQRLQVQNFGDVEVTATVTAPAGYQVRRAGDLPAEVLTFRLAGYPTTEELLVEAPRSQPGTATAHLLDAMLRIEVSDLPESSGNVTLHWLADELPPMPAERWIIGIDFGTAKTAIFFTDCNLPALEPVAVQWLMPTGQNQLKVPSVIMYPHRGGKPEFGWRVPENPDDRDLVIRSIKKRLADDISYTLPDGKPITAEKIVEHYLKFLIGDVRRQEVFRGQPNPFETARVVMSLPVRGKEEQYEAQKARTVQAAVAAGLREEQIVCYPEPECAAVDFLRRRDELGLAVQDGELMCVFDCGAGTTDICVLQVHLDNGHPSFTRRSLAGFPFGGDVVDELLTQHAIDKWRKNGELSERGEDASRFGIAGTEAPLYRTSLLNQMRSLKESLTFPTIGDAQETGSVRYAIGNASIEITWDLVEELFRPFVQKMVEEGFSSEDVIPDWHKEHPEGRAVGTNLSSLEQVLWDAEIDPADIKWLCLTGGSSLIPFLVEMLQFLLPHATLVPSVLGDPLPLTLNVAQGAAVRPLFKLEGQLQGDFLLQFTSEAFKSDEIVVLANGSAPGKVSAEVAFPMSAGASGTLKLIAQFEKRRASVYATPLQNPDTHQHANVLVQVEYGRDMKIYLTITFGLQKERRSMLPKTIVVQ